MTENGTDSRGDGWEINWFEEQPEMGILGKIIRESQIS